MKCLQFYLQDISESIRTFAQNKDHEAVDCCVLVILSHSDNGKILGKQECIPVGCVPPAQKKIAKKNAKKFFSWGVLSPRGRP